MFTENFKNLVRLSLLKGSKLTCSDAWWGWRVFLPPGLSHSPNKNGEKNYIRPLWRDSLQPEYPFKFQTVYLLLMRT